MLPEITKLFEKKQTLAPGTETIEELVSGKGFYLELIQSLGDSSDPGAWFDQDEAEWVALVKGDATLEFEEGELALVAGDALTIAPHLKHRVAATSVDAVWVAVHYLES